MANNFNEAFAGGKMIPKRLRLCFAFAKHKGSTKRKKLLSLFCVFCTCSLMTYQSWRKLTVSGYYVNFKPKVLYMLAEYDQIPNQ